MLLCLFDFLCTGLKIVCASVVASHTCTGGTSLTADYGQLSMVNRQVKVQECDASKAQYMLMMPVT